MINFVIYTGDNEIIVCIPATEAQTLREYFIECDRNITEYERQESSECGIMLSSEAKVMYGSAYAKLPTVASRVHRGGSI